MSFPANAPDGLERLKLKAIETEWNGVFYRSRLEAKYAIFFETARIPFRYEQEGYELAAGRYLPDFWLPDQQCFVEIKGGVPNAREMRLAESLAVAHGSNVFIFTGGMFVPNHGHRPPIPDAVAVLYAKDERGDGSDVDHGYAWCECPQCGVLGITYRGLANRLPCSCPRPDGGRWKVYNAHSERLMNAYRAATSARFEHGESGSKV